MNPSMRPFERLLQDAIGLDAASVGTGAVERAVRARMQAGVAADLDAYWQCVRHPGPEQQLLIESVVVPESWFFRDRQAFVALAAEAHEQRARHPQARLRVLSLPCAGGEEPYSIAMTVAETFGGFNTPVSIIASDLDTNVLATADKGVYAMDRVERLSPERLKRFFLKGSGSQEGFAAVRPELRRMVQFQPVNLLDATYPVKGPLDVIFCRNVMIYFDKPTQYKILSRYAPMMQEDGLLFAGHSESFLHAADLFRSLGKTVYELSRRAR